MNIHLASEEIVSAILSYFMTNRMECSSKFNLLALLEFFKISITSQLLLWLINIFVRIARIWNILALYIIYEVYFLRT